MMKRTLSLLLASLMLITSLAACSSSDDTGKEKKTDTTADTTTAEPETELSDNLPEKSLDGYNFRFFVRPEYSADLWVEEESSTGDAMNAAVYERNQRVADRFDVKFSATYAGEAEGMDCLTSIQAGVDSWDLVAPHGRRAFTIALNGCALNWNLLPYVDLERDWWDQDARQNFTLNNQLYCMIGDISYLNVGYSFCMMFNKKLFDDVGIEYPYQSVLDGTWTWDKWEEILAVADSDLNADGVIDWQNDRIGYMTHQWYGPFAMQYTTGMRGITITEDGPEVTFMTEQTVDAFQRYFKHISGNYNVSSSGDVFKAFKEGRIFTIDGTIDRSKELRDMEDDFGIVPWPKYDESYEYASSINAAASLFIVPVTIEDPETTSIILEALAFDSSQNVIPVYYETILKSRNSRDSDSAKVIDIIRSHRVFDFGYFNMDLNLANVPVFLYTTNSVDNIVSYWEGIEESVQTGLKDMVELYDKLAKDQSGD